VTAYSPGDNSSTNCGDQRPLFSLHKGSNGALVAQLSVEISPNLIKTVGDLLAPCLEASGYSLVPNGYRPPPSRDEIKKQQLQQQQSAYAAKSSRLGRIAASRHRKLSRNNPDLSWYDAMKAVATELQESTENLQNKMKGFKRRRDLRVKQTRQRTILRLNALGQTDLNISRRLGIHEKTVSKLRREANRERTLATQEDSQ